MGSEKIFFKDFPMKTDSPWAGQVLARGHNFNNLGKGTLGDTTYQISKVSEKKIFKDFPMKN